MAFWAIFRGLGLLFYLLLVVQVGSRDWGSRLARFKVQGSECCICGVVGFKGLGL